MLIKINKTQQNTEWGNKTNKSSIYNRQNNFKGLQNIYLPFFKFLLNGTAEWAIHNMP